MTRYTPKLRSFVLALATLSACSDFFGEGPDPSRAGRSRDVGAGARGGTGGGTVGSMGGAGSACSDACSEVVSCLANACRNEVERCLGPNFAQAEPGQGECPEYLGCVAECQCDQACANDCRPQDTGACSSCLGAMASCQLRNCSSQTQACVDAGSATEVITDEISTSVRDLALDDEFIYFTTSQGLARIAKTGGTAMGLHDLANAGALAVSDAGVYLVDDSGRVIRVSKDGSESVTLVAAAQGGGSGAIVVDATQMFYTVGNFLRRAPLAGGGATELANDVRPSGQSSLHGLAQDDDALYYAAQGQGAGPARVLRRLAKDPADAGGTGGSGGAGGASDTLATTTGDFGAVASDGVAVYFTELSSDGLSSKLEIKKLVLATRKVSVVAAGTPDGGGPGGNAGSALAVDGGSVYFGLVLGLFKVTGAGGPLKTVDATAFPLALAFDETYVYWNEQSGTGVLKKTLR